MHADKSALFHVLTKSKKFFAYVTKPRIARFIVVSFVALVMLTFTLLLMFGLWSPVKALNSWKNQRIINQVNDIATIMYNSRSKYNGVPSNSQLKEILKTFNPNKCVGGVESKMILNCEGSIQGVSLPKTCQDAQSGQTAECNLHVFSPASVTHGELGAGRFRLAARLFPTAYDKTGVEDETYYVYDYAEGGFYCSGNSKFDSRDSVSKVEFCRSVGR
jgi:hypothetical protein